MAIIRQAIKGCGANEANEGNEGEEGCRGQYSCFLIGGDRDTGTSTEVKDLKSYSKIEFLSFSHIISKNYFLFPTDGFNIQPKIPTFQVLNIISNILINVQG